MEIESRKVRNAKFQTKKRRRLFVVVLGLLLIISGISLKAFLPTKLNLKKSQDALDFSVLNDAVKNLEPTYFSTLSEYTGDVHATNIPFLMYHNVIDDSNAEYDGNKLQVDDFRKHMEYLHSEGYYTLTGDEFSQYMQGEIQLPPKSIVISFDDGFNGMKTLVEPILQEFNLHAISFIIGDKTTNEPAYFLTPDEISEMAKRNYFEFQSHSFDLHEWSELSRGQVESVASSDFKADNEKMKTLIGDAFIFCYPYGHYGGTAQASLAENGFKYAVTVEFGMITNDMNPLELPRIRINAGTSVEEFASFIEQDVR